MLYSTQSIMFPLLLLISSQQFCTTNIYFLSFWSTPLDVCWSLFFFLFFITQPHKMSHPCHTWLTCNHIFFRHSSHHVRTPMISLAVEAAMPYPHFPFLFSKDISFFAHLVIQGELRFVILLWIPYVLALITGRESVVSSCAYPGFTGILLCGFLCLLSLCTFVTSGSPHEPILLMALLIYDSKHAALSHTLPCATPAFS